jgi:hypothetical protein
LTAAGLPLLQRSNPGAIVATQNLCKEMDIGIFFTEMGELREKLADQKRMDDLRHNVWRQRQYFTFDQHADRLIDFFRRTIENVQERGLKNRNKQPNHQRKAHQEA